MPPIVERRTLTIKRMALSMMVEPFLLSKTIVESIGVIICMDKRILDILYIGRWGHGQ